MAGVCDRRVWVRYERRKMNIYTDLRIYTCLIYWPVALKPKALIIKRMYQSRNEKISMVFIQKVLV